MTIEEMAEDYSPDAFNPDEILPVRAGYIVEKERHAYCIGAADRMKIDIGKACKWLCKHCPAQFDKENGLVGCEGGENSSCPTMESLINAMEEE